MAARSMEIGSVLGRKKDGERASIGPASSRMWSVDRMAGAHVLESVTSVA